MVNIYGEDLVESVDREVMSKDLGESTKAELQQR
jgi:hypothetical protein